MNNGTQIFITCAIASFVPWAVVVKPLGVTAQAIALAIQIAGLIGLVVWRKKIWG